MKNILALVLISAACFAATSEYNTTQRDAIIEMASDKTAMQTKLFTNEVTTSGADLVFSDDNASVTSGALTTVGTNGVITIGRNGVFRLRLSGSMEASGAVDPMELRIYLNPVGDPDTFVDTGFSVVRDIAINKHGSFASEFHGERAVGDKIKVVQFSDGIDDFIFNSIAVTTDWME